MREFSETLTKLAEALIAAPELAPALRVRGLTLDFPLEVRLTRSKGEWSFEADAPNWRWQTPFDVKPGRLRITWEEELSA